MIEQQQDRSTYLYHCTPASKHSIQPTQATKPNLIKMKYTGLMTTLLAATTAVAVPLENTKRANDVYPYATYRRWVSSGELVEDPQDQPLVVKTSGTPDETTTLVTFNLDASTEGRTCRLDFNLWGRDTSTGSQTMEVFSLLDPAGAASVSAEASRALAVRLAQSRDKDLGRIRVPAPGTAEWVMAYYGMPEFPCPAGQLIGMEFVGVGDDVTVQWDIGVTGPIVRVL